MLWLLSITSVNLLPSQSINQPWPNKLKTKWVISPTLFNRQTTQKVFPRLKLFPHFLCDCIQTNWILRRNPYSFDTKPLFLYLHVSLACYGNNEGPADSCRKFMFEIWNFDPIVRFTYASTYPSYICGWTIILNFSSEAGRLLKTICVVTRPLGSHLFERAKHCSIQCSLDK